MKRIQEHGGYYECHSPYETKMHFTWAEDKKLLSGLKSSFHVGLKVPEWWYTDSKLLDIHCKVPTVSNGSGSHIYRHFIRSKVSEAVSLDNWEHFVLPSADHHCGDFNFILEQDLAPAHCQRHQYQEHGVSELDVAQSTPPQSKKGKIHLDKHCS